MYEEYWNLNESPFCTSDGRRRFHDSPQHEEALSRLLYLVDERRRCGLLTGDAGTGKSLLLDLVRQHAHAVGREFQLFDLAGVTGGELLSRVCGSLPQYPPANEPQQQWLQIEEHLRALPVFDRSLVWMFDSFEQAGMGALSTLERLLAVCGRSAGYVTIIVATRLQRLPASADRLAEAIELRAELARLPQTQTAAFVNHLSRQAGAKRLLFDADALELVHDLSHGVPRSILRLCDLALLAGMGEEADIVTADILEQAAAELRPQRESGQPVPLFH